MAWVILGLGMALCVSGAAALWSGVSYMPVEWGWSQIIAGATAITGGIVTMALAAVVHRLRALQSAMVGLVEPRTTVDELEPEADQQVELPDPADRLVPEPSAERASRDPSSGPILINSQADEAIDGSNGYGRRVGIGDVVGLGAPLPDADVAAAASAPMLLPDRTEAGTEQAYAGSDADETAPAEADGAERTVVGRYQAGGASYALFSDGTIEVETDTGVHRFGSMDELKQFLERQDRANQADWPE